MAQDAQADCDGEGNRQAQRHKEHIRTRNVPNEITIYTYTTKTTKRLFFGHFVAFVETVAFVLFVGYRETVEIVDFVIPLGYREIVISLKPLISCFS